MSINSENIVDVLREKLQQGEVKFVYKKKDGSRRAAVGTTNLDLVPREQWPKVMGEEAKAPKNESVVTYYDMEKLSWRSFKIENGVEVDAYFDTEKQSWRSCKPENGIGIEGEEVEE